MAATSAAMAEKESQLLHLVRHCRGGLLAAATLD